MQLSYVLQNTQNEVILSCWFAEDGYEMNKYLSTVEPRLTSTLLYGHLVITATFFWPEKMLSQTISYLKNPFNQASYGSWKTWKDLEFYCGIFQDWKVQENGYWSWKVLQICWTQVKNMNVFQTAGRISNEILGVKGLMWIIKSWKNQSESWRSPGIFSEKGYKPWF